MVSAAVKTGLSLTSAIHLAPVDARRLIRERVQEAVARAGKIAPLTMPGPLVMEIVREEPWPAQIREGAERVDAFTSATQGIASGASCTPLLRQPDLPLPE